MTDKTFSGRHYETGAITNALQAIGAIDPITKMPYSEALALGASGGIAFGHFVFEYTGHLPHVAILPRNTFAPFARALDNLGIAREEKRTTNEAKAETDLIKELELGNAVLVWADMFSMPYRGLNAQMMWAMNPMLVVGTTQTGFLIVDGTHKPIEVSREDLGRARARVKKDRFQSMVLQKPDPDRVREGLIRGIKTCTELFLDKPPAGSSDNFGIAGMKNWVKLLTDPKNPKGWTQKFEPGPRLVQALAGKHGQPGTWTWIEAWGTGDAADRGTYAVFLREASKWLSNSKLLTCADLFESSAPLWRELANRCMPDSVVEFKSLKELRKMHALLWLERGRESDAERAEMRAEMSSLVDAVSEPGKLEGNARDILEGMADTVSRIVSVEENAANELRAAVE